MVSANVCGRCGGAKTVWFKTEVISAEEAAKPVQPAPSMFRLCMCPIERPKHDGKLDDATDWRHAEVEHNAYSAGEIYIHGGYGDEESSSVSLDAKQALSLLAWLKQEEAALEKLAKEQA